MAYELLIAAYSYILIASYNIIATCYSVPRFESAGPGQGDSFPPAELGQHWSPKMFETKIFKVSPEGWELKEWKSRSSPKVLKADAADRRRCFWASCDGFFLKNLCKVPKGRHQRGERLWFFYSIWHRCSCFMLLLEFPDSTGKHKCRLHLFIIHVVGVMHRWRAVHQNWRNRYSCWETWPKWQKNDGNESNWSNGSNLSNSGALEKKNKSTWWKSLHIQQIQCKFIQNTVPRKRIQVIHPSPNAASDAHAFQRADLSRKGLQSGSVNRAITCNQQFMNAGNCFRNL